MKAIRHGAIITEGDYKGSRWCKVCDHAHGPLYNCPHYPLKIRKEIARESSAWKAQLMDDQWCKKQIENGLPPIGIEIFRCFAGIKTEEEDKWRLR